MSGEGPLEERLMAIFEGVKRLKEDVESLGGDVVLKTSLVLALDNVEGDLEPVDASWISGLDKAAVEIANDPGSGEFMRKMADAWLSADKANKEILGPTWQRLLFRDRLGRFMEAEG